MVLFTCDKDGYYWCCRRDARSDSPAKMPGLPYDPTMSLRWFVAIVGAVMAVAAAVLLFMPFSSAESVPCGNALSVNTSRAQSVDTFETIRHQPHDYAQACLSSAATRRSWGFVLGAVGLISVAGAVLVRQPVRARE
jgi:hypothetical protein